MSQCLGIQIFLKKKKKILSCSDSKMILKSNVFCLDEEEIKM